MPSRATYAVLTEAGSQQLDPEQDKEATTIFIASQLARIVCRAVELSAFSWLQKELNGLVQGQRGGADVSVIVPQLGNTLLNLKWRLSLWEVIETEPNEPKEGKRTYTERVQKLCRILYTYYFIAQRKLSSWSGQDRGPENSLYLEHPCPLPHDESPEGFEQWMQTGSNTLLKEVGE